MVKMRLPFIDSDLLYKVGLTVFTFLAPMLLTFGILPGIGKPAFANFMKYF